MVVIATSSTAEAAHGSDQTVLSTESSAGKLVKRIQKSFLKLFYHSEELLHAKIHFDFLDVNLELCGTIL